MSEWAEWVPYLLLVNFIQRIVKSHTDFHIIWYRYRKVWFYLIACSSWNCMIFFQLNKKLCPIIRNYIVISYNQSQGTAKNRRDKNVDFKISAIEIGCLKKSIPNWWNILGFVINWITKRKVPDIDQSILFQNSWLKCPSMSLSNNFLHQIYWSNLAGLFLLEKCHPH